jgi:mRNA interferase RelE/StbE
VNIRYSEQSIEDLRDFNPVEQILIAKKIEYLGDNFELLKKGKKVRELKGTAYDGQYRYTIARKIRALFRIDNGELVLLILRVGKRKDVYED